MGDVRLAGLAQLPRVRRRAYRPGAPQQCPLLGGQVVRCALQVEDVVGDRVVGGGRVLEVGRLGGGHGTSLRLNAGIWESGLEIGKGQGGTSSPAWPCSGTRNATTPLSRGRKLLLTLAGGSRSEAHTSELQSLMRNSYAA